ncbi:MAG: hypothetical protein GTO41_19960 [Burkholderiales bacterium]|nr:hypothetical protein [Burkholderiales bacterium]
MSNNSVSNFNARCRKIEAKPAAGAWLANSLRLILVAGFKPHGNKPILLAKYHGSTCDYFSDSDDILRAVEFDCKSPISGEN